MANHHPSLQCIRVCGLALFLSAFSGNAFSAGFALIEQSVSSMGTAYAGAGSAAEDASTVFFNPAGMSRLQGRQLSSGLHLVVPNSDFKGGASFNAANPAIGFAGLGGVPIAGSDGGNGGEFGAVPHFTYVQGINDRWTFGLGVNAPFGLSTEYDSDWVGRYSAIESEIFTLNLNPTLSFRFDEHASIGFGISAMYAKLELENAVDAGVLAALSPLVPDIPGWVPGSTTFDGRAKTDIDDWGFGFNFGLLLEPTDHTRFGLAYRSKVDVELDGDVKITGVAFLASQDAKADVDLPDTLLLSAYHEFTPKLALMADIIWTQWSHLDELKIELDDGSSNTIHADWEDVLRIAVGASYKYSNTLTLRTGLAHDESPIPNQELRLAALPDADRIWLNFGVGYRYSDTLSFDLGYAHLFINDPQINSSDADSSSLPGADGLHLIDGEYDADTDIFSAQVNWKF